MRCERGSNTFAKSIDPCPPARIAQADIGRNFSPSFHFLPVKGLFYIQDSVGGWRKIDFYGSIITEILKPPFARALVKFSMHEVCMELITFLIHIQKPKGFARKNEYSMQLPYTIQPKIDRELMSTK